MLRTHKLGARTREGVAAVEFAIVFPLLLFMLVGIIVYGGWFWLAHSVQSVAYEAARASLGGLDSAERRTLALDFVALRSNEIGVPIDASTVQVNSDAQVVKVKINYDVSNHPLMALRGLTVSPPMTISKEAVVRLGGY